MKTAEQLKSEAALDRMKNALYDNPVRDIFKEVFGTGYRDYTDNRNKDGRKK